MPMFHLSPRSDWGTGNDIQVEVHFSLTHQLKSESASMLIKLTLNVNYSCNVGTKTLISYASGT